MFKIYASAWPMIDFLSPAVGKRDTKGELPTDARPFAVAVAYSIDTITEALPNVSCD